MPNVPPPQLSPASVAIVLGSGLDGMIDRCDRVIEEITFAEAGLPSSTVPGHAGSLVRAELAGRPVWILRGRVHLYEGHDAKGVTAGVRWLAARGVRTLVLTNAAGCLNPAFAPGEWMMISDHLNLTGTTPLLGGPHFHDMSEVYARPLRRALIQRAFAQGLVLREGVYAGLLGPQYETPAEVRLLRLMGADAVGMSTVLEAVQARALGLEVAAFSCLTNMAAGFSATPLDHKEVVAAGQAAAASLIELLADWLGADDEHTKQRPDLKNPSATHW